MPWLVRFIRVATAFLLACGALVACTGSDSPDPSTPADGSGPGTTAGAAPGGRTALRRVGITFGGDLTGLSRDRIDAALDDVVTLHMRWIRVDVSWANLQPSSAGGYRWTGLDQIVDSAREHDVQVLALVTYTPGWARDAGCYSFVCPPREPRRFAEFAGAVAERYADGPIAAYQVWNEPNLGTFWPQPDPARYRVLLRETSAAIRQSDPGAGVVFGGLAALGAGSADIGPAAFVRRACRARACTRVVGAVGYDPFTYPRLPGDTSGPYNAWQLISNPKTGAADIRRALVAVGLARTPVWVTGFGAPTRVDGYPDSRSVTPERQRDILLDGLRLARRAGPLIGGFFVNTLRDSAGPDPRAHFGIVERDGTRKPAFTALARALR